MSGSPASPDRVRAGRAAPGPLPAGLSRDELVAEVRRALAPIPRDAAVVVAFSGGSDSTALAYLSTEARPDLAVTLGHVRHGLRPDAADVAAVRAHASALGSPLAIAEVTVASRGEGIEAAARAERYAALRRIAREAGAGWLLVGHTADDQAETLLLRLSRGTGVGGLGGMAPVRGDLVRPLLRVRRSDVRRFIALEGLDAVEDPMNRDPRVARVRARYEVLPALEVLAPDPVGALARLADLARADARRLRAEATALVASLVRSYGPARAVPADELRSLDPALAPRVVRELLEQVRASALPVSAAHVNAVLELRAGGALDLPGATVTCGGGWIAAAPADLEPLPGVPLAVPGRTRWEHTTVLATVPGGGASGQLSLPLPVGWVPPTLPVPDDALPPGGDPELGQVVLGGDLSALGVRARRRGDRIATAGGTKKLQDALVDAGVPRALRDLVPIVTAGDRIVWVPGIAVDATAADAGRSQPALHLALAGAR